MQGRAARAPRDHGTGQQHGGTAERATKVLLRVRVQKSEFDQE